MLVLHGLHDTDPARAREVADIAPRGQGAGLEGAAHCPWLEQPDAMAARLRAFLRDLGTSGSAGDQDAGK